MFCPNIFANRYADFSPVNKKRLDGLGRLKITLLVKDVVSRAQRFVSFADRLAALEQRGGVPKRFAASFVAINKPDEQRRVSDASVQFIKDRKVLRNKPRFENQILRRVSGDRQLRC